MEPLEPYKFGTENRCKNQYICIGETYIFVFNSTRSFICIYFNPLIP